VAESGDAARVSLRHDAPADPEAVGEDAELAEAIRAEIRSAGPIPFARFMERALYEPGHGYYRRPDGGPGLDGDCVTSPEAHPIFGAAIGQVLEQAWEALGRPAPFVVSEPGAGTGALAAGLLDGLRDLGSPLLDAVRYRPVEVESGRRERGIARLREGGFGAVVEPEPPPADRVEAGAVVANEVLDALPVHRIVGRPGGIRELLVALDDGGDFRWVEADPTTPALAERLAAEDVRLGDGEITEVCLVLDGWLAGATHHLARGLVLLVDYAAEPSALHGSSHPDGTLRAFTRHAVGADPFRHAGRQDLTATVDLAAVRAAARTAGLDPIAETTQAELLAGVDPSELVGRALRGPDATLEDALRLRSALARLLDPRGMGGFRVLAYGRGMPPDTDLPGLRRLRR
jgi:SAM-dependent MidA family methyltransferase